MAKGFTQTSKDIIDDSQKAVKTTYSSKKIEDLVANAKGTQDTVFMLGCYTTAPTSCNKDDVYYNTTSKLIFTATATNMWDSGTTPKYDILYVSDNDKKIYKMNAGNLEVYGGGGGSSISSKSGNAIQEITGSSTPSENGIYVEDLSNKVNALNIAQKTVNSELEYYYATVTTSSSGVSIKDARLINYLPYLTSITSNLESSRYNTKGVILKKAKTYKITFGLTRGTTSGNGASAYIMDSDGNKLGNRGYFGSTSYNDNIIDTIYTPTKDITVYPALVNLNTNLGSTYYPDCSFFQITEVGRTITVDPVEYVDSTKGIEDTPVGEIIRTLGYKTPKHYLACDGTVYNIADYSHLAQYFKDNFGSSNAFGGDGTTTFAVPDLSEPPELTKISPIMTSDTTPSPYKVTRSSVWSAPSDHAWRIFDEVKTGSEDYTWISAANELHPWICVDLGTKTKMTSFKLWLDTGKNKFPEDFTLQGSNDGTNFTNIKSFTNVSSMAQASDGEIEFNLDRIAEYRYYKIYVDTLQITGGATYVRIYEWEMFYQDPLYRNCIKYEPTYFMVLQPTGYDTLDVDCGAINVSLGSSNTAIRTLWTYTNNNTNGQPIKINLHDLVATTNTGSNEGYITVDIDGVESQRVQCPTNTGTPITIPKFDLQPGETFSIKTDWVNTHSSVTWKLTGRFTTLTNSI